MQEGGSDSELGVAFNRTGAPPIIKSFSELQTGNYPPRPEGLLGANSIFSLNPQLWPSKLSVKWCLQDFAGRFLRLLQPKIFDVFALASNIRRDWRNIIQRITLSVADKFSFGLQARVAGVSSG